MFSCLDIRKLCHRQAKVSLCQQIVATILSMENGHDVFGVTMGIEEGREKQLGSEIPRPAVPSNMSTRQNGIARSRTIYPKKVLAAMSNARKMIL